MTPLALILVGDSKNTGIFTTQSDLANKIATSYGKYYPNKASIRPLITQVLAGNRKVPQKLSESIIGLLSGMSSHIISAVKKEIEEHNNVVVPLTRTQKQTDKILGMANRSEQNTLCRDLVRTQISSDLREKPLEQVAAEFGVKCRNARPQIRREVWQSLFF